MQTAPGSSPQPRRGCLRRRHRHSRTLQSIQMAKRSSEFGKDGGLQARMLLTMFLLGLVYVVFVGALIAAGAAAGFIVVIALFMLAMQFFTSDKIALSTLGAKEVTPEEQPELHGIIERLCVQADLPKPRGCVVMTVASFFATLAALIAQFSLFFGGGFGGGFGRNQEEEEGALLVLVASVLVYAISFLLLQALSRYREFAADRGSAVLTGRPSAVGWG